jgi:hypothetical protein
MKQNIFFVLALILFAIKGQSQEAQLGLTGGFNFAKWNLGSESSAFDRKARAGIFLGIKAELPVAECVDVQTELLFSMLGAKFEDRYKTAWYRSSYLVLPVMGKYNFKNGISVMAGPQLGYLLSAKTNEDGDIYNFREDVKKTDLFFVLGAEYHFKNGISAGMRMQHGLSDIDPDDDTAIRNRAFSLTAAYTLKETASETLKRIF